MKKTTETQVMKNKIYDRLNTTYQVFKIYFREIQDRDKLEEAILIELVMATEMVMNSVTVKRSDKSVKP